MKPPRSLRIACAEFERGSGLYSLAGPPFRVRPYFERE
jgi:hypothetical protein